MSGDDLLRGNPIRKFEEDSLDRGDLVSHLSNLIVQDSINDSCTIGLIGKWGCGKSSVINLIEERVNKLTEGQEKFLFIRFNPIDYSADAKGISKIFFDVLITNLKYKHKNHPELVGSYKRNRWRVLGHLVNVFGNVSKEVPDIQGVIDNLKLLANAITNPADGDPVEVVRDKISKMLSKMKLKLIVVIDDIDRLDAEEAIQILKLIRITANFQNVIYFLAYDEEILSNMINKELGPDYLEKFIQVPVRLPEIDTLTIQEMLYSRFITSMAECAFEPNEYTAVACKSIQISTIRDLHILMNKYRIKIKLCSRDVSPEDLLVLTFIEMKDLALYNWIYENRLLLCDTGKTFVKEVSQAFVSPLDPSIEKPEMKNGTEKAVEFLYPHLFESFIKSGSEGLRKYQIRFRLSCDVYFLLKVPSTAVSNKVLDCILKSKNRVNTFCNILSEKIKLGVEAYNSFLTKMIERFDEFHYQDKIFFARALLFDDKLIDPELAERFSLDVSLQPPTWEALLDIIFKELTESDIETVFRDHLPDGKPYALALDFVYLHGLSVESNRGRDIPMTSICFDNIKKITGNKLCGAASYFQPNENAHRTRAFFVFLGIVDSDVAKREFNRIFDTDKSIIKFIRDNFTDNQIRAFEKDVVKELSGYIPDGRLPSLINYSGEYRNIFERMQTKTKD